MEATGPYSEASALHTADAGRVVSVVNPTRIKYAGLAWGRSNKTDRADAELIARHAAREHPPAWQPPPPHVRELQALVRRIADLTEMAAREKGRLAPPALTKAARQSVARTVRLLEKESARVRAEADTRTSVDKNRKSRTSRRSASAAKKSRFADLAIRRALSCRTITLTGPAAISALYSPRTNLRGLVRCSDQFGVRIARRWRGWPNRKE